MDPLGFAAGRIADRARKLPSGRQGPVSFLVQQGEGGDLAGWDDLGSRNENRAESDTDLQSRGEGEGDQTRADVYERVREESEREIQVIARMRGHPRASGGPGTLS